MTEKPPRSRGGERHELFDLLSKHSLDLLLLDLDLSGLPTGNLLCLLRTLYPQVRIIAMSGKQEFGQAAIAAGADVFACKMEPPGKLLNLIRELEDPTDTFLVSGSIE